MTPLYNHPLATVFVLAVASIAVAAWLVWEPRR